MAEIGAPTLSRRPLRNPPLSRVLYTLKTIGGFADVHPLILIVNYELIEPELCDTVTEPFSG